MLFEAARHIMQPLCTVTIIECTLGHSIGSSAGIKVELSADLVCVALPLFLCALFLAHPFKVLFGEVPWCAACCQLQSGVLWCSPWCKMVFPFVNLHSLWCIVAPRALPSSQLFARGQRPAAFSVLSLPPFLLGFFGLVSISRPTLIS